MVGRLIRLYDLDQSCLATISIRLAREWRER